MEEDHIISKLVPKVVLLVALFFLLVPPLFASNDDGPAGDSMVEYSAQLQLFGTNVGGTISKNTTWTLSGSPYTVTSSITITSNATLTIKPGVVVKFKPQFGIVVGSASQGKGCLAARGTAESPIVFTSYKNPPNPGDWSRIHFTDYTVDATLDVNDNYLSGSVLEHVVIEYAGYNNYGAILADKSRPFLNYCEVRHNSYYGIQVDGTNSPRIIISNCQVWDNAKRGISIWGGTGHKLLNNNIHDNRNIGIYFYSSDGNTLTGNTISGNTSDGVGGGIVFYNSSGNTLTGNTISGNTSGGAGGGIYFYGFWNTLEGNTISGNTSVSHGGGICFYYSYGINTLTGNTISDNTSGGAGGGIYFYGSGNTLTENTISDNKSDGSGGGIIFYNGSGHTLTGNTVSDNTSDGTSGGIYFGGDNPGDSGSSTLTGNIISGNKSGGVGGGITFYNGRGNTLTKNTVQNNISGIGFGTLHLYTSGDTVFSQNTITANHVETGTIGGIYIAGSSEQVSLAGDPNAGTSNIIRDNDGYQVYNDNAFDANGLYDVNAIYVYWGTSDTDEISKLVFDHLDNSSRAFVLFHPPVLPGDFDMDDDVDWVNLATFVDNWLREDCAMPDWCEGADLNVDTKVDFLDFAAFVGQWLKGVRP